MYDLGQALTNKIDASHSTTNRARKRDLIVVGEERGPTMLHYENMHTNSNFDPKKMAEVEIWKFVAAVAVGICVGVVVGAKL